MSIVSASVSLLLRETNQPVREKTMQAAKKEMEDQTKGSMGELRRPDRAGPAMAAIPRTGDKKDCITK